MNRWLRYLLVLIAAVLAVWLVRRTLLADDPVAVRTVRIARGPVEESVTNSKAGTVEARRRASNSKAGTVEARRRAKLSPGTSGIVAEVRIERGQLVKQGEPLVRLADDEQRANHAGHFGRPGG